MRVKEGAQYVRAAPGCGPTPIQSPLNGNPASTPSLQAREPSSINDHFVSWKPHLCSPFSPQDDSPGPSALGDSLQRTLEHSHFEHSFMECLLG